MVKNKKFVVMLAIFVLGAVLLTGCGDGAGGESELEGEPGITDSASPADEERTAEAQATDTVGGTLKAMDAAAGTVTIATESGDELVLKVTGESKILVGESLSTIAELASKIGSGVSVEYHAETKTVTAVSIKG